LHDAQPMVTTLQCEPLRRPRPSGASHLTGRAYEKNGTRSKLDILLGDLLEAVRGKVVVDFGCGYGDEAVELERRGAARVIGVDINQEYLREARRRAADAGVSARVEFATRTEEPADVVVSLAGLNRMTERRFLRIGKSSQFTIERLEPVPIRHVKRLHNRLTREFFTSIVRCKLRKPERAQS